MQDQGKKTLIGAFVVGALALGVGGVLAFGGGSFFEQRLPYLVYFDGFVDGLDTGSPVVFRGVKIGEVDSVRLVAVESAIPLIEVVFSINPQLLGSASELANLSDSLESRRASLEHWIERGIRAQLGTVSLLTGQLKIDLDLAPKEQVTLRQLRADILEVPSIPSSRERISEAIQSIPYETLAQSLTEILTGIRDLVKSPEIGDAFDKLNTTIETFDRVLRSLEERLPKILDGLDAGLDETTRTVQNANRKLDELSAQATPAIEELRLLLTDYRAKGGQLFDEAGGAIAQSRETMAKLDAEIAPTSAALRNTLDEAHAMMRNLGESSAPGAPIVLEMRRALEKLSKMLDAFAALAETLERQPESILKGKSGG